MPTQQRFRHEIEWYEYYYIASHCKVGICHKTLHPCKVLFYSKEKLLDLIQKNQYNLFLLPILKEALNYFPQEVSHA